MVPDVLLALSLAGLVLVANALWPLRWDPLSVPSFFAGWLTGELAFQHIVWQAALVAGLGVAGAFSGWAGWVGLGVAVVDWAALGYLGFQGVSSASTMHQALSGLASAPGRDGRRPMPAWFRWWRVALAVPIRGRGIERIKDLDYWGDRRRRHRLDIIRSRRQPPSGAPVLVQIHGGAWIIGDKREQAMPLMFEMAAQGWVCVAVNYRLGPRDAWPAQIVDCKRALAWVKEHIAEYGGDPSWVVVTGGSAGGHLSALCALSAGDVRWQPGFEEADTSVAACVPFYGVYDMTGSALRPGHFGPGLLRLLERLVMKTDMASHREVFELASPIRRVHPNAPPFLVIHGTNDTLVPVGEARRFVAALKETSSSPVAYAELRLAQHAFDVLVSPRCWAACGGVMTFLDSLRHSPREM